MPISCLVFYLVGRSKIACTVPELSRYWLYPTMFAQQRKVGWEGGGRRYTSDLYNIGVKHGLFVHIEVSCLYPLSHINARLRLGGECEW